MGEMPVLGPVWSRARESGVGVLLTLLRRALVEIDPRLESPAEPGMVHDREGRVQDLRRLFSRDLKRRRGESQGIGVVEIRAGVVEQDLGLLEDPCVARRKQHTKSAKAKAR